MTMYSQAVILAGGKGTRLMPLTLNVPKPMVQVASQPFLFWQLTYLKDQGVTDVLLLVSHMEDVIQNYFHKNPVSGLKIRYGIEKEPMGTGGALKNSVELLPEVFFLLNGDSFLFTDLVSMAQQYDAGGWEGMLAAAGPEVVPVPANLKCENGIVTAYKKDGGVESGYTDVDAGVYLLSRSMVATGPSGNFDLGVFWPALIARKKLAAFKVWDRFFDIGTPERLKTFEKHLKEYF